MKDLPQPNPISHLQKKMEKISLPLNNVYERDVQNKEHLAAYHHMQKTGAWPSDFYAQHLKGLTFPMLWYQMLAQQMVQVHLSERFGHELKLQDLSHLE